MPYQKRNSQYLFEIGDVIKYRRGNWPGTITGRKRVKDYFALQFMGVHRNLNFYAVTEIFTNSTKYWLDEEKYLTSYNCQKPDGAADYESDENEANYLNSNGHILLTVKSGEYGYAHELVFNQMIGSITPTPKTPER